MANPKGTIRVEVQGETYTLHLGFSGLAELQAQHGLDFISRLQPPESAAASWMPDVAIVRDMLLESLQRHHADDADRWLVDDLLAENPEIMEQLMEAAFPDASQGKAAKAPSGNGKGPRRRP